MNPSNYHDYLIASSQCNVSLIVALPMFLIKKNHLVLHEIVQNFTVDEEGSINHGFRSLHVRGKDINYLDMFGSTQQIATPLFGAATPNKVVDVNFTW